MASRHDEATAFLEGGSEEAAAEKAKEKPDWDPNAMIPFGPRPVPEHRWFESKPLWARLYILLAGVTMNFLLGWLVSVGLALAYGEVVIPNRLVGTVRPINGQPLLASALQPGDSILRVNGEPARTWSAAMRQVARSEGQVTIETTRGSVTVPLNEATGPKAEDVALAIDYQLPPVIGDVLPTDPAGKAGLRAGDSVVTVDGVPIRLWSDMVARVADAAGKPLQFVFDREGRRDTVTIVPRAMNTIHPLTGERGPVGKIGAYPPDVTVREPLGVGGAVVTGTRTTIIMGASIVTTVRDLFTRRVSMDQLGGPIAITRASVAAARSGMENLFYLIALLSVNVGILNLLPIPILDGGQVLINVLESARGRAFSLRTREYILRGGLLFILLLFVLVMFNDTRALLR